MSPIMPLAVLAGVRVNAEQEARLLMHWGKFTGVRRKPGLFWVNPCAASITRVSLKERTMDLRDFKCLDLKGNPVIVSGVIFWRILGVKASVLNVEYVDAYVRTTAMAVLKEIVSRYPYEDDSGRASLKTESEEISQDLVHKLDVRLGHAGVDIEAFNLTDLNYAPEIAQQMLVKQQAEQLVKARQIIVKGAVDITQDAMSELQARGIRMTEDEERRMTSQLLSVICAEKKKHHQVTRQNPHQMQMMG